MSILIKGVNAHRGRCWECPCLDSEYGECNALKKDVHYIKYEECPLIEIPEHGDLIDRDALMTSYAEEVKSSNNSDFMQPPRWNDAVQLTELAPVVIPAERSEE